MAAVVVALMQGRVGVAIQGMRAIGNLADNNDDNRRLLGAAGACEGESMNSTPDNLLTAFASLCFGMVAVVLAVLRGPLRDNEDVAEAGMWAVRNLTDKNDDNIRLLRTVVSCDGG